MTSIFPSKTRHASVVVLSWVPNSAFPRRAPLTSTQVFTLLLLQVTSDELRSRMVAGGLLPADYSPGALVLIPSSPTWNSSPFVEWSLEHPGFHGMTQTNYLNSIAADVLDTSQEDPRSEHTRRGESSVNPVQEQPRQTPQVSADDVPQELPGPARGAPSARKIWTCNLCRIPKTETGKLRQCSVCQAVRYCGQVCQKKDWPAHKTTCKRMPPAGTS
jgi:hypothetical protein